MSETATIDAVDTRALRDCCARFATGVTVVTTRTAKGDHGMTVSAFMSVSLDPPLICISLDAQSRMLPRIEAVERFAVNILPEDMSAHALHFAGRSQEELKDLFEDRHGSPVLRGAGAVIVTDLVQRIEAGDHVLLVSHVRQLDHDPLARPLVWHGRRFVSLAV